MRHRILATAVLLTLLTGCQAPSPVSSGSPSVAPSPSPTPEPAPSSDPEPSLSDDLRPAYQTVRNYLAAYDEWGANPTSDYTAVTKYTIDDAEAQTLTMLDDQMKSVARVTGEPVYRGWSVRMIDPLLDGTAQASVKVCSDNAKMTLEHNDGSKKPANGTFSCSFTLQQGAGKTWQISDFVFRKESC